MINSVILVGRVTRDIELKKTQSDISVVTFSIAVNRQFPGESGEREADFISCVAWRHQADNIAKYVKKGYLLGIQGRLQTRQYESEQGMKYVTEVVCENVQFLEAKKESEYPTSDEQIKETYKHGNPTNKPKEIIGDDSDSLPF